MAIQSETFSSVQLSGKDAARFVEQVKSGRPPEAALKSAERGKRMLESMRQRGRVVLEGKTVEG